MPRDDEFRGDDITPIGDLSQPIVEPTFQGLANAIIRLNHTQGQIVDKLGALTKEFREGNLATKTFVDRDECYENRKLCPGAARMRKPSGEQPRREDWLSRWQKGIALVVSILALLGMIGSAWWWSVRTVSAMQRGQDDMRQQIMGELKKKR